MPRKLCVSLVVLFGLGCAHGAAAPESALTAPQALATRSTAARPVSRGAVAITTEVRTRSVRVRQSLPTPVPARWRLPSAPLLELSLRDDRGPLPSTRQDDELQLTAEPQGALHLEMRLDLSASLSSSRTLCPVETTLNADFALLCGDAVLASPMEPGTEARALDLRLSPDPDFHQGTASTFGLGARQHLRVRAEELRRAFYAFGLAGEARFEVPEGRDHAAWLGFFSFDPRWVAAEAAGMRSLADRWFELRRPQDDPSASLLLVSRGGGASPTSIEVRPTLRGAVVEAGLSAGWSARSRLDLMRVFVQRTLAALQLRAPAECHGAQGTRWFYDGFAHAIAFDALQEAGLLDDQESRGEVNSWLLAQASSPRLASSNAELCQDPDPRAAELLAIRGALVGLAVRGAALRQTLCEWLKHPEAERTPQELLAELQRTLARPDAALGAAVLPAHRGEIVPRSYALGPCARLERRRVTPFGLGFTRSEAAPAQVLSVSSPAAEAGVRSGDAIERVTFEAGRPEVPVQLELSREGQRLAIRYLPRAPARSVALFGPRRCR